MITDKEPIIGHNIDELRVKLGLSIGDACWVFGIARNDWTSVIANSEPVDAALAELVRFYNAHPEFCPAKPPVDIGDLFDRMTEASEGALKRPVQAAKGRGRRKANSLDMKAFAIMLGKEASAAYRWVKMGSNAAIPVVRMMEAMDAMLKQGKNPVSLFMKIADTEAKARGVPDVWTTGKWSVPGKKDEAKGVAEKPAENADEETPAAKKVPAKRSRKAVETTK